jgi:hypothetical protein
VCMSVTLVSGAASIPYCVTPPNAGGTAFIPLQTAANSNGYFTGPMTEVVDVYATSCLAYTGLPEISYGFAQGAYISSFVAWSDEFNTSGAICYGHETPVISEPPGSSLPIFVEATNGSIYGPTGNPPRTSRAPRSRYRGTSRPTPLLWSFPWVGKPPMWASRWSWGPRQRPGRRPSPTPSGSTGPLQAPDPGSMTGFPPPRGRTRSR